jgi:hypothetical protein
MTPSTKVCERLAFCVPVKGKYVLGVVSRVRGPIAFAFFFLPEYDSVPTDAVLDRVAPDDAAFGCLFGTGAISTGEWPTVGTLSDWDRGAWKIPVLRRYDELLGRDVAVYYEDDPVSPVAEEPLAEMGLASVRFEDTLISDANLPRLLERQLAIT